MKTVNDFLTYANPKTHEEYTEDYTYPVYASVDDAVSMLGMDSTLDLVNRMTKVDSRNKAAAKAKAKHGFNEQTPEQKAQAKIKARNDRDLLARIKANPALLAQLGM